MDLECLLLSLRYVLTRDQITFFMFFSWLLLLFFLLSAMTLFPGLGTDVHFSGDETGLKWEDYLFELQNAVEWRMVMSRGQDERSQMHVVSLLLNTCNAH